MINLQAIETIDIMERAFQANQVDTFNCVVIDRFQVIFKRQ
ncbi:MAG: hypothetical protein AB4206_01860 [Xenococcaceae cyanobacterium]